MMRRKQRKTQTNLCVVGLVCNQNQNSLKFSFQQTIELNIYNYTNSAYLKNILP